MEGFWCCVNDTTTTEIYPLSLHDALPISRLRLLSDCSCGRRNVGDRGGEAAAAASPTAPADRGARERRAVRDRRGSGNGRSEEHTSELQSRQYLVCRLLLEKNTTPPHRLV